MPISLTKIAKAHHLLLHFDNALIECNGQYLFGNTSSATSTLTLVYSLLNLKERKISSLSYKYSITRYISPSSLKSISEP